MPGPSPPDERKLCRFLFITAVETSDGAFQSPRPGLDSAVSIVSPAWRIGEQRPRTYHKSGPTAEGGTAGSGRKRCWPDEGAGFAGHCLKSHIDGRKQPIRPAEGDDSPRRSVPCAEIGIVWRPSQM